MADRWYVGVLLGGTSDEHDVSVNSGLNVLDALGERGHRVTPIYLAPDGRWYFGHRPEAPSLEREADQVTRAAAHSLAGDATPESCVLERLAGSGLDAVFVALHGPGGEDGVMQGTMRLCGVPFTGSDVLASALAMDKARTKRILRDVGVPCPEALRLESEVDTKSAERIVGRLGFPCVVKPVAGGSSFGTRVVVDPEDLHSAIDDAGRHDGAVLVESFVAGTEVTCGVLGGGREATLALPLTEIVPPEDGFFDFRAKYTAGACEEITPARVSEEVAREVQRLAVLAHETLGCEGMSRSDFIVGPDGPVYLETNTIPGLTRTSLLPQGAAEAGIGFPELVERIVRSAVDRAAAERAIRGT